MRASDFINETKLTNADFQNDIAKTKAGKADPSDMANKWGSRGGAFLNFVKSKDKNEGDEFDEQSPAANAKALMGSGRGPTGTNPKGKGDSPAHKAVRTPGTTYSKRPNQKKYGKPGANDGFIG